MTKRNPALVVFGNPQGKPRGETNAWRVIEELAAGITGSAANQQRAAKIIEIAETMRAQVKEGIHTNAKGTQRNPKNTLIGKHVQAIIYVHAKDGERYIHAFGNAPISIKDYRSGAVKIGGMYAKTDVECYGTAEGGAIIRGARGQRLWDFFEV